MPEKYDARITGRAPQWTSGEVAIVDSSPPSAIAEGTAAAALAGPVANWALPVRRWAYRQAGTTSATKSDAGLIDPMLRRRLSPLARLALSAAVGCSPLPPACRVVYASQHGEIQRTTQMLEALAHGETPSPTAFSLSVLNATPGVLSIARNDRSAINAVSAGDDTLGYALLDAWAQHRESPDSPVLLIHAFEPPPACYGPTAQHIEDVGSALALLIDSEAPGQLTCTMHLPSGHSAFAESRTQSDSLVTTLLGGGTNLWRGERHHWQWDWHEDAQNEHV